MSDTKMNRSLSSLRKLTSVVILTFLSNAPKLSYITPTLRSNRVPSVWGQSLHIGSWPFPFCFCCDLILTMTAETAVCLSNFAKGDNACLRNYISQAPLGCSYDIILTNKLSAGVIGWGFWERSFEKGSSALHCPSAWNTDVLREVQQTSGDHARDAWGKRGGDWFLRKFVEPPEHSCVAHHRTLLWEQNETHCFFSILLYPMAISKWHSYTFDKYILSTCSVPAAGGTAMSKAKSCLYEAYLQESHWCIFRLPIIIIIIMCSIFSHMKDRTSSDPSSFPSPVAIV